MKTLLFFLLLAAATAAAQSNQISVATIGNFNPTTYIWYSSKSTYEPGTILATSSMKSSLGGGIEYRHWFTPHQAFGMRYEQNPSDGKLLGSGNRTWYIWPQMRYEFLGMFTEQVKVNRFAPERLRLNRLTPFIQEGAGALVTHEYGDGNAAGAGWSHSLAFAGGFGSDYWVNNRLAVRLGTTILADETGCYDDPTCRPTFGLSHDLEVGFSWAWGRTAE